MLRLPASNPNQILALSFVSADCSATKRVARSHSGFEWEGVPPEPIRLSCDEDGCTINIEGVNRGSFRVDAYERPTEETPTVAESTARLLLQGTFGPTNDAITEALVAVGRNQTRGEHTDDLDTVVAAAWVDAQIGMNATLLRAHFRKRANPRVYYDASAGGVAQPCEVGSRWSGFAFDKNDLGKVLAVDSVPDIPRFRLTVDGVNRGETDTWKKGSFGPLAMCRGFASRLPPETTWRRSP